MDAISQCCHSSVIGCCSDDKWGSGGGAPGDIDGVTVCNSDEALTSPSKPKETVTWVEDSNPTQTPVRRVPAPRKKPSFREAGCCAEYGHRLTEDDMLKEAHWCLYCCCAGCGTTTPWRPFRYACHCLCCHFMTETAPCSTSEDLCKMVSSCTCCTWLCQMPSINDGRPHCTICSRDCCGYGIRSTKNVDELECPIDSTLDRACCVPCWCRWCGLAMGDPAFWDHSWRCCCCACKHHIAKCGCVGSVAQCCGCVAHCLCPCRHSPPNPVIAICGRRCRKPLHGGHHIHAPTQHAM